MKKIFLIVLFAIFLVFVVIGAASAATNTTAVTPITVTSSSSISGHYIVYQKRVGTNENNYDIYKKNLISGQITTVINTSANEKNPDIYGNIVVWQSKSGSGKWQIWWKNTSSSKAAAIVRATPSNDQINPRISGTRIVWQYYYGSGSAANGHQPNYDIRGYDLATNSYRASIASTSMDQELPDINGNTVVYQEYINTGTWHWRVKKTNFISNPNSGSSITLSLQNQTHPRISSNNKVVWSEYNPLKGTNIWCSPNPTIRDGFWVSENIKTQINPDICGNKVVWMQQQTDGTDRYDIYMKDLSSINPAKPVVTNTATQIEPAIGEDSYGIFVSWTDTKNGYNQVCFRNMDITSPYVISTIPTNLQMGFGRITTIAIKFSENIKSSTYYNYITIKNLATNTYVSITKSISGNTLFITTTATRSANTWYQVTIHKAAIKDYAGNNLLASYTFKFRTRT